MALTAALGVLAAAAFAVYSVGFSAKPSQRDPFALPATPASYVGLYLREDTRSYAGINAFTTATAVKPGVVSYYSSWPEPFQSGFASTAARNGAVPLVQINPVGTSIAAIAAGQYDGYLTAYARAVRTYNRPVIVSFGHEMNGYWYSWGNTHTPPAVFVNAWRHLVDVFRAQGTRNVTWLWTVNNIGKSVPSPRPWWPGSSYVTWIGIDGYYTSTSSAFSSVFGPTVAAMRAMTRKPILISETAASPAVGQPAKIADLFAGIRLYGLLGFVWFGADDWRLSSPAAIAAFRRGAQAYHRPTP